MTINKNNEYNNADSFAMAFDEAWKSLNQKKEMLQGKEERLKQVLELIKEHPFILSSKDEAIKVAEFRIRLLNLD